MNSYKVKLKDLIMLLEQFSICSLTAVQTNTDFRIWKKNYNSDLCFQPIGLKMKKSPVTDEELSPSPQESHVCPRWTGSVAQVLNLLSFKLSLDPCGKTTWTERSLFFSLETELNYCDWCDLPLHPLTCLSAGHGCRLLSGITKVINIGVCEHSKVNRYNPGKN